MCQRTIFSRSCIRIAEEVQLQAEEEWIVDALKKIKQQRNCLQIERLHLESLKIQLKDPELRSKAETDTDEYKHVSAVDLMNPALGNLRHKENSDVIHEDALCNEQELNLMVLKPTFDMPQQQEAQYEYDMDEEDEDEDEEEEEDGDNMMIDINMLMNGTMR